MSEHCAHETGLDMATFPLKTVLVCCRCGVKGYGVTMYAPEEGHGPYAPVTSQKTVYEWEGECKTQSSA